VSVDLEALQDVLELYRARRADLIELRRRGENTHFLAKCKQLFDFLEARQDGLAYLIEAAMDLASAYGEIGDWASAEPIFEKCVAVRGAVCGPCHETTATALMMLGVAKHGLHKYTEAESLLLECINIRAEVVGESHPHFALALMNLAAVYEATGREHEGAKLRAAADQIGLPHFLPRPKPT
jgi:tetratricopeptide (TPR) repeat protein